MDYAGETYHDEENDVHKKEVYKGEDQKNSDAHSGYHAANRIQNICYAERRGWRDSIKEGLGCRSGLVVSYVKYPTDLDAGPCILERRMVSMNAPLECHGRTHSICAVLFHVNTPRHCESRNSAPMSNAWDRAWDDAQPALAAIRASMAAWPPVPARIMRVGQLDAELLDQELLSVLKEPINKALGQIRVSVSPASTGWLLISPYRPYMKHVMTPRSH